MHLGAVKSVPEELGDWRGIPDHGNIVNMLPNPERHFIIANWMLSSHFYAIRLSYDSSQDTPLFGISGDFYWKVAVSFTEFGEKYLKGGVDELL
jgi:hypothetical protein